MLTGSRIYPRARVEVGHLCDGQALESVEIGGTSAADARAD